MKKFFLAVAILTALVGCKNNNEPTNQSNPADPDTTGGNPQSGIVVSTEAQKRIAVIEEYTGVNCGYCPDGHKIVSDLIEQYPGQVFGVNIHAGGYAANYKTTEGTAYANAANINGYPAGSVNRHVFSAYSQISGGMAMSRGNFENAVKKIMKMSSPVNIGASAEINTATSELKVKVKGYFTADPEEGVTTNSLYVLLLQDSVMGYQNGMSRNPDQVVGSKYRHMHMLRAAISDKWGDEISPIAAGSWFEKEYTYTIPATIGTDNIPTVLKDMRVIIYVAAGKTEIYTVAKPDIVLK